MAVGRIEAFAQEINAPCLALAENARPEPGPAHVARQPDLDERRGQHCRAGRDADIAGTREAQSGAGTCAVDHCDRRFAHEMTRARDACMSAQILTTEPATRARPRGGATRRSGLWVAPRTIAAPTPGPYPP